MGSMIGEVLKVAVFGQSHSEAIGVTIDGLPAGFEIDMEQLKRLMARRAPGHNQYGTNRKEKDEVHFLSGLVKGKTCGAPLTAIIYNTNTRSRDYDALRDVPRPGHADYAAAIKYHNFQDVAGGGHFSGRLTAPLCIAGGICEQILAKEGIEIFSHIKQLYTIYDVPFDPMRVRPEERAIKDKVFPVISEEAAQQMMELVEAIKNDGDSVGGVIETRVTGMPVGIGEHMFDGIENRLSKALFGIPAVKGISFGNGFDAVTLKGSENNDPYRMDGQRVVTETNRHGGILGGMSTGMPILFDLAIKPTSSIFKVQHSVSLGQKENRDLLIEGRHDPCIALRAVPVVEAVTALSLFDLLLENRRVL